jgi:hypothetical protein
MRARAALGIAAALSALAACAPEKPDTTKPFIDASFISIPTDCPPLGSSFPCTYTYDGIRVVDESDDIAGADGKMVSGSTTLPAQVSVQHDSTGVYFITYSFHNIPSHGPWQVTLHATDASGWVAEYTDSVDLQ